MLKLNGKKLKGRFMYCNECCERTFHEKVGSSSQFAGENEVVRGMVAVYTLGLSEMCGRTKYHRCIECGNIYEEL